MRGLAKGTIRVGAVASLAGLTLPQAIANVLDKWPKLHVHMVEGVWDRLAEALVKHEIDLALGVAVPDTDEITAITDCQWEDCSHVVAATDHPLRSKPDLRLADVMDQRWTSTPKGTAPYEHMARVFAANGLGMPEITVETRSIVMLKSLVVRSGFLSWFPEPMYDSESQAGLMGALPISEASGMRTLTVFRRRYGILPGPAVKLLDELRALTTNQPSSRS
jgi:DNA-binding transcriptional LysR family regulator